MQKTDSGVYYEYIDNEFIMFTHDPMYNCQVTDDIDSVLAGNPKRLHPELMVVALDPKFRQRALEYSNSRLIEFHGHLYIDSTFNEIAWFNPARFLWYNMDMTPILRAISIIPIRPNPRGFMSSDSRQIFIPTEEEFMDFCTKQRSATEILND